MMCTAFSDDPEKFVLPEKNESGSHSSTSDKKISRENQCFNSDFISS